MGRPKKVLPDEGAETPEESLVEVPVESVSEGVEVEVNGKIYIDTTDAAVIYYYLVID